MPMFGAFMAGFGAIMDTAGGYTHHYAAAGTSQIFRNIFMMKLPYLLFDVSGAFVILSLFDEWKDSLKAFKLWVFSPIIIYVCYAFGQFDIMPTFFMLLCFYFIKNNNPNAALLSLGIGAAYKNFPFFALLPLAILLGKNNRERLKLAVIGTLPYLIFFLPLYVASKGFVISVLFPSVFVSKFDLRIGEKILFVIVYASILINAFFKAGVRDKLHISVDYYLIIFIFFYALFPLPFHYYIWITPAIIIAIIKNKKLTWLYFIQAFSLFILTAKNIYMFGGLFAAISPSFAGLPSFRSYVDYLAGFNVRDIANLAFLISSLIMVYILYKEIINARLEKT